MHSCSEWAIVLKIRATNYTKDGSQSCSSNLNVTKAKNVSDPQFFVIPAKDGKSWSIFCELGYRRPVEIPDFPSEKAAQYWINAASKKWLEKFSEAKNV